MDDIRQTAIDRFQAYLARRQFSAHTVASYTIDLRLFFAAIAVPLARVSFHEVDQFVGFSTNPSHAQHDVEGAWAKNPIRGTPSYRQAAGSRSLRSGNRR